MLAVTSEWTPLIPQNYLSLVLELQLTLKAIVSNKNQYNQFLFKFTLFANQVKDTKPTPSWLRPS